uniref:Transposase n=1 Tax=Romanomermis culicivorax TaxID=13658 RepID=A0A915IWB7_ROMCU
MMTHKVKDPDTTTREKKKKDLTIRRVADAIEYNKIICKFDSSGREAKAIRRKVGEPKIIDRIWAGEDAMRACYRLDEKYSRMTNHHILLQLPMTDHDVFTIWLAEAFKRFSNIFDLIYLEP